MKLLVAYATTHGSTAEIAEFMKAEFEKRGFEADAANVTDIQSLQGYDAFVVGSPIYGGMWLTEMSHFLTNFQEALAAKPVYFFITCIRVLEEGGRDHALQEYVHRDTLRSVNVRDTAVFAGKMDVDSIDWSERWTLSVHYDGKELPGQFNDDYRNWNAIASWVDKVATWLETTPTK